MLKICKIEWSVSQSAVLNCDGVPAIQRDEYGFIQKWCNPKLPMVSLLKMVIMGYLAVGTYYGQTHVSVPSRVQHRVWHCFNILQPDAILLISHFGLVACLVGCLPVGELVSRLFCRFVSYLVVGVFVWVGVRVCLVFGHPCRPGRQRCARPSWPHSGVISRIEWLCGFMFGGRM